MNSVHEQCPNSDLEIVLSPKTGWVHQVHSLPSQNAAPKRACRGCVVGRPRLYRGLGRPCRGLAPRPRRSASGRVVALCRGQARPCRGLGRDIVALPTSCSLVTIHLTVS